MSADPGSDEERVLYERYAELVEAAGPSELTVTRTQFAWRTPYRRFTGGFFKSRRLELWFDLPEPIPEEQRDERFREVWQMPHAWVHRLKIGRPEELDERLGRWIAEARAFLAKPPAER